MVSMADVRRYIETHPESKVTVDGDVVTLHTDNGDVTTTLEEFTQEYRRLDHCDFESIFSERASLLEILRCRQCGTVIFTYNDERYDDNLRCPTCGGYKTGFQYYTKEEIESDSKKKEEIDFYVDWEKEQIEQAKRWKRRGGKYDWQLGKKKIKFKNHGLLFELECNNICKSYIKGLRLIIHILRKDESGGWIYGKRIHISLSISDIIKRIQLRKYRKEKERLNKNEK